MSKANQRLFVIHALWMGGGMFLLFLAFIVNEWFLIGVFILMITVSVLSYRVRCHSCRWPLIKRWWGYTPWAPKNCPKCGEKVP